MKQQRIAMPTCRYGYVHTQHNDSIMAPRTAIMTCFDSGNRIFAVYLHSICIISEQEELHSALEIQTKQTIMTPTEIRNELLAQRLIKNLNRRNMDAYYCPTANDAIDKVTELLPKGATVSWGGSMTIRDMGLTKRLHETGLYTLLDRDLAKDRDEAQEIYLNAFRADFYISGINAISEDGVIVNIDGNGNRVAAITFGPKHVIFVAGINKVTQNVEAALARARSTAAPINTARFDIKTPCKADGVCHNCNSTDCICNHIHFLRNSPRRRHTVVIVGENLGY